MTCLLNGDLGQFQLRMGVFFFCLASTALACSWSLRLDLDHSLCVAFQSSTTVAYGGVLVSKHYMFWVLKSPTHVVAIALSD